MRRGSSTELQGTASYTGDAAGRYVRSEGLGANEDLVVSNGEFIAEANLTAIFGSGDGTIAAADQFSISGSISNFMDGSDDLGWTLMLNSADLGTNRDAMTQEPSPSMTPGPAFSGTTTGDASAREGAWSGTMYGADDTTTTSVVEHPTGVTGEFNGHFSNGHVIGAFGATEE